MSEREVLEAIDNLMKMNIRYGKCKILGFPGTTPHPISIIAYSEYLSRHPNNIGLHTMEGGCEVGFGGTQEAERQVIAMAADMMDANPDEIDGYISSGGTEGNDVGCWMGRDARKGEPAAIICSFLTHYSATKAANNLRIGIVPNKDKTGLHVLGTDENGHVLLNRLEEKINELARAGISNIIVIGNAGTTMLGSVDNIPEMSKIIKRARKKFNWVNIHFHIDAAFGGFIIPFIKGLPRVGFSNESVDSIIIDAHKTGLTPYGSGIIMARKGIFQRIKTDAPYVPGNDYTLCGSRPGVMALSCWAVMRRLGKNGYARNAKKLMDLTDYAQRKLKKAGIPTFKSDINIVAVKGKFPPVCSDRFITHAQDGFPSDLSNPASKESSIWNIVVMEHTTKKVIDDCIAELKK